MSRQKTNKQFVLEVKNLVGDEYEFIDNYIDNHTKLRVIHKKCQNTYMVEPKAFLYTGRRCPYCNGGVRKKDEDFIKDFYNKANGEYILLSNYNNANARVKVKHLVCNNEYYVKPSKFLSDRKCPFCYGSHKKSSEEFKHEVENITNGEYEVLDDYITALNKIRFRHKKCGNIFNIKPNTFLCGSRCPFCKQSKGEKLIEKYFIQHNIYFEPQKQFNGCKVINNLKFDFYVPKFNICIEYDGEFHYRDIFKNGDLEKQKNRDLTKNNFCIKNNMKLIRIPYWNFDKIYDILDMVLSSKDVNINKIKEGANG